MIYLALLAFTVIPLFCIEENVFKLNEKRKKQAILGFYILAGLSLVLVSVLRLDSVGIDSISYKFYFYRNTVLLEKGYYLLIEWFKRFSHSYFLFKGLISLLILVPILSSFYVLSKKRWMSLFLFQTLYLYVASYSLFRQYLVIAIMMIALYCLRVYLRTKNWYAYIVSVLLIFYGSLFHSSAIAMMILPLVALIGHRRWLIGLFFVGSAVLFIFRQQAINFLILSLFKDKIHYINSSMQFGIVPFIQYGLIVLNQLIYRVKAPESEIKEHENEYLFVTNLSLIWFISIVTFSWFSILARVTIYISFVMCAFVPNYMKYTKKTYLIMMVGLVVFYVLTFLYRDYQAIYPYQWILG